MKTATGLRITTLVVSLGLCAAGAQAAIVAEDDAADPVYATNFDAGMNGGTGFGGWAFNGGVNSGRFIGNSNLNGFGDVNATDDINTVNASSAHVAWGLFASAGEVADAVRPLAAPIQAGDTIRLSIDNGFVDTGGVVGFGLQNSAGENLLEVYFAGGDSFFKRNDAGGAVDTATGFTSDGFDIEIVMTSATEYSATMTIVGGTTDSFSGTLSSPTGGQQITQLRFFNFNAGTGSTNDFYFNKLQVESADASVADWMSHD